MDQRTIWVGGDWRHADFAAAVAWLSERACLLPLPEEGATAPQAILVFQSRPGQISRREVEHFHARAPLARLVALVGPWCEGEQRSGRPWPGVVRVGWRSWPQALPRALGLGDRAPNVRLPRTATETDRLQQELAALRLLPLPHALPTGKEATIAIRTGSRVSHQGLSDAVSRLGFTVVPGGAALELIDGWEQWPLDAGPPRMVLLHFPRPDDMARARQLGAAALLAHPLHVADLAAALARLLPRAAREADSAVA